eukprot:8268_1
MTEKLSTSNIITIVYFCANLLLVLALALVIKRTGEHASLKSTSFWKDLWCQRKIYLPVIVHIYDTATDAGVLYYWYTLMINEQNGQNYVSVNMTVFFWSGIAVVIMYRVGSIIGLPILFMSGYTRDSYSAMQSDYYRWTDFILIIFDLFIFRMVYFSARDAQKTIADNIEKRKNKKQQKTEKQLEMQIQNAEKKVEKIEPDEEEIEPDEAQMFAQIGESVLEALPQIVLQSVFIIRSQNDETLKDGNIGLILVSCLASLASIASKFIYFDGEAFGHWDTKTRNLAGKAYSLKPRKEFPDCIQYWYLVRVLWRICSICSNFAIYVLVWVVCGGAFLPMYAAVIFIVWIPMLVYVGHEGEDTLLYNIKAVLPFMVGQLVSNDFQNAISINVGKYLLNVCGLSFIAVFGVVSFECGICSDPSLRKFENASDNIAILVYYMLGCAALIMEIILYTVLNVKHVFERVQWRFL